MAGIISPLQDLSKEYDHLFLCAERVISMGSQNSDNKGSFVETTVEILLVTKQPLWPDKAFVCDGIPHFELG